MLTTKSQLDAQVIANPPIKQALLASQCPALFYRLPASPPSCHSLPGRSPTPYPSANFHTDFFFFLFACLVAWGIKIPDQGLNPCPRGEANHRTPRAVPTLVSETLASTVT